MDPKLKALLTSRKFYAALIGLILLIAKAYNPNLPVTEDQATSIIYVIMAYIIGTAIEDHGTAIASVGQ